MSIILASQSPRRKELLEQIGLDFQIIPAKGEEEADASDATPVGGIKPLTSSEWSPGTKVKTTLKKSGGGTIKMDASSAGTIDLQTTHVGSGKTAQFNDLTYTNAQGQQTTIKVLSTDGATIPPGGSSGSQTEDVITGIAFDFDSNNRLVATLTKKRLTVVAKEAISDGTADLPLWEHNVVVSSAYNSDNDHKFKNKVTGGVVTHASVDTTTSSDAEVFTSTAHSAE